MPLPQSVMKVKKNGIEYTSSVIRAKYTLRELTRAALRDIGKYVSFGCRNIVRTIANRSLRRSYRVKIYQFWNRKRETDLIVGIKGPEKGTKQWYGIDQELGLNNQPKRDILRNFVFSHIDQIIEIQSKYLKHIEDEMMAQRVIDENAEGARENDQDSFNP